MMNVEDNYTYQEWLLNQRMWENERDKEKDSQIVEDLTILLYDYALDKVTPKEFVKEVYQVVMENSVGG